MKRQAKIASVMALVLLLWIATLSIRPLYEPDEGRYAEVPREMYVSGDWVTPRLNGVKFFDKPPLQYWATASAYSLFGPSEWTARIWSTLAGLVGVLASWWAANALYGRHIGSAAAWVLIGAPLWILGSNLTTTDIGVGALLGSAVLVFAVAFQKSERRLYPVIWLLVGLAFLAKGLIAVVLPAGTLLAYAVLTRQYAMFLRTEFWRWSPLAVCIALPWIIAVSSRNPEFLNYFFIHEHFARFSSVVHERNKPVWFFLAVGAAGLLPFAALIGKAVLGPIKTGRNSVTFDAGLFLSLWVVIVIAFFSISKSKLPLYILPAFPPAAVLLARTASMARARVVAASYLGMPLLGTAIGLLLWHPTLSEKMLRLQVSQPEWLHVWGLATVVMLAIGGVGAMTAAMCGKRLVSIAVASLATLGGIQGGLMASRAFDSLSIKPIGLEVRELASPGTTLFNVGQIDRGLAFYARVEPTIVGARSELDLGFSVEPSKWIGTESEFVQRWGTPGHKLAVMRTDTYERLQPLLGVGTAQRMRSGSNVLLERK